VTYPLIIHGALGIEATVANESGDFLDCCAFGWVIVRVENDTEERVAVGADTRISLCEICFQAFRCIEVFDNTF